MISGCTSALSLHQIAPPRPARDMLDFILDQPQQRRFRALSGDMRDLFQFAGLA